MALLSPLPSCARGHPFRSRMESGTPGTGVLVPASIRGELACSRKSSVVSVETSQFARILKAAEAEARAGVKVRTLVVVLTAVVVRATPAVLYSSTWVVL